MIKVSYRNSPRYQQLKVRLGEWDTQTTDEPYPYQDRKVKEVRIFAINSTIVV